MLTIQSAMPLISTVKGSQNVWSYTMLCASILLISKKQLRDVSDHVQLDPKMKVLGAVGKFHLSDHVDSCFSLWTLNFMEGSGHIDGKIMETLWSGMNKVSGSARSMSKAHRQETLDDYMRDSN